MNETKYASFEPFIIRTKDFLPTLEPGDPELFDPTRPDFVPARGERCLQVTKPIQPYQQLNVCLNDGKPFTGRAFHLPVDYDHILDTWKVVFCFCSLPCVKRYSMSSRMFRPDKIMPLISLMALKVYGVESVIAAPPREMLTEYLDPPNCDPSHRKGLTIEKYRSASEEHDLMISLDQDPFQMSELNMMTLDASSIISTKSKKATIPKVPKKLFQQSPYTRKRNEKKKRLEEEKRLLEDMGEISLNESKVKEREEQEQEQDGQEKQEGEKDMFVDLPSSSFAPQPQCVEHPQVKKTLLDVLRPV